MSAISTANEIIEIFTIHGGAEYAGEKVSQLEHMYQAAQLAETQGYDDEVILAAFLHDIGHLYSAEKQMDGFGTVDHEEVGASYLLTKGFSERLVRLVQSHVEAKRYLTWKRPDYYAQLSEASKKTLEYQGGRMDAAEAKAFEEDPMFDLMVQMRLWDDEAKIQNLPVGNLESIKEKIIKHLEAQQKK